MRTKYYLYLGIIIPFVFWMTTIICGTIQGGYNHLTGMVSELGEINTSTQYLFSLGLFICAVLSVLFVVGLYKACKVYKLNVIPVLIILSYSFSIAGAAIFPFPTRMHLIFGMPSVLLIFSPLLGLFLWQKEEKLIYLKLMSIISLIFMFLGFTAFYPGILSEYHGLKQRFFHIGWTTWFLYLYYGFSNLLSKEIVTNS
jgi:hypothetical membrane protein